AGAAKRMANAREQSLDNTFDGRSLNFRQVIQPRSMKRLTLFVLFLTTECRTPTDTDELVGICRNGRNDPWDKRGQTCNADHVNDVDFASKRWIGKAEHVDELLGCPWG